MKPSGRRPNYRNPMETLMTRKQLLVLLCGTATLVLVVLLMVLGSWLPTSVAVTAASGPAADPVESTDEAPGLSGGNDCYCSIPYEDRSGPTVPAPATE